MKNRFRRTLQITLLISALLGVFLITTAGIFSEEVTFKNVKKSFIDLDAMVEDKPIGQGGNKESGTEGGAEVILDSEESSDEIVELTIMIRETKISLNGSPVNSSNFRDYFEKTYRSGMRVVLVDDFAEYYTFMDAKKMLEDKGIIYQEVMTENMPPRTAAATD